MSNDLAAAMRRATELTRGFNLSEATKAIQDALAGRAGPAGNTADVSLPETAGRITGRGTPASTKTIGGRILKPLAEVVETLRQGRATVLDAPADKHPAPAVPDGAQFVARSFTCDAGGRAFKLFIPAKSATPPRGLILMLHGCQQNPDDFATGTRMNEIAAANNLVVAYPSQPSSANAGSCWNWFSPAHQMRDRGEPAILAGLVRELMDEFHLVRGQVFVAGLSAGGAMAAVLAETYPDVFCAAGIHSGLAYGSANDVMSAFAVMRGDTTPIGVRRSVKTSQSVHTIIFQGDSDRTVHPSNARRLVTGLANGDAAVTTQHGETKGRPFTLETHRAAGAVVELWTIGGAGHAWSGGNPEGSFAAPHGPDASAEFVRFFLS